MSEMTLKQPGFTYSACGPFTKNKGDTNYNYKNELGKAYFQHDMAYGGFKDLARRTASDEILGDKAFNKTKNPKHGGCQRGLTSMAYKIFDEKSSGSSVNNEIKQNQQLAQELHKTIIKN